MFVGYTFLLRAYLKSSSWRGSPHPPLHPGLLQLTPAPPGELAASPASPTLLTLARPPSNLPLPRLLPPHPPARTRTFLKKPVTCVLFTLQWRTVALFNLCHNEVCLPLEVFPYSKWIPWVAAKRRPRNPRSLVLPSEPPWPSSRSQRCLQSRRHRQQYLLVACGTAVIKCRSHG